VVKDVVVKDVVVKDVVVKDDVVKDDVVKDVVVEIRCVGTPSQSRYCGAPKRIRLSRNLIL